MSRKPWYESDNPSVLARSTAWRAGLAIIGIVVFVSLISAAVWGVNVLTSDPKGRGDAYRQKESANNRIFAQQSFEQRYADIQATVAKIGAAEKVRTESSEAETRYEGLTSYCAQVVGEYNAAARSYTTQDFRSADLPSQLDPTTDCEPAK